MMASAQDKEYQEYLQYLKTQQGLEKAGLQDPRRIPESTNEAARKKEFGENGQGGAIEQSWDPGDIALMFAGEAPAKLGEAAVGVVKSPLKALDKLIGASLKRGTGLDDKMYQVALKNPELLSAFRGGSELAQQSLAKKALESASSGLSSRASGLEQELQSKLAGKFIPETEVLSASQFKPKTALGTVSGQQIPASDVYQAAREAGKAANFAPTAIDPMAEAARVEQAGKEFGILRGAVGKNVPEAEPTIAQLQQGIKAQQALKSGRSSPLGFMGAEGDTAAARQLADQLSPESNLEATAQAYQASQKLKNEPKSWVKQFLIKPAATAGLSVRQSIDPAVEKANQGATALGRFIGRSVVPGQVRKIPLESSIQDDPEWKEYQAYLRSQGQ